MKRTKNMVYIETTESDELYLYAVNDSFIYERIIIPVIDSLKKKVKRGVYDSDKAVDVFYHVSTEAARKYDKEFSSRWQTAFSVTDRFTTAVNMEKRYQEEIMGLE